MCLAKGLGVALAVDVDDVDLTAVAAVAVLEVVDAAGKSYVVGDVRAVRKCRDLRVDVVLDESVDGRRAVEIVGE